MSSTFADNRRQVVLNMLELVECRLRFAAQKGIAVVECGGNYTARDCLSNVVVKKTVHVVQGADVAIACPSDFSSSDVKTQV